MQVAVCSGVEWGCSVSWREGGCWEVFHQVLPGLPRTGASSEVLRHTVCMYYTLIYHFNVVKFVFMCCTVLNVTLFIVFLHLLPRVPYEEKVQFNLNQFQNLKNALFHQMYWGVESRFVSTLFTGPSPVSCTVHTSTMCQESAPYKDKWSRKAANPHTEEAETSKWEIFSQKKKLVVKLQSFCFFRFLFSNWLINQFLQAYSIHTVHVYTGCNK